MHATAPLQGPSPRARFRALKFDDILERDGALDVEVEARLRDAPAAVAGLSGALFVVGATVDTAGAPTRAGLPGAPLAANMPPGDAPAVAALRAAGATLLGRASCGPLGLGWVGAVHRTPQHGGAGAVRNPWSAHGVAGGGQPGTAAAVGSRLARLGVAVDTAGELLVPAALCGAVCFRGTPGRYGALHGCLSLSPSLDALGVAGGCVEDVATADAALLSALPSAAGVGDAAAVTRGGDAAVGVVGRGGVLDASQITGVPSVVEPAAAPPAIVSTTTTTATTTTAATPPVEAAVTTTPLAVLPAAANPALTPTAASPVPVLPSVALHTPPATATTTAAASTPPIAVATAAAGALAGVRVGLLRPSQLFPEGSLDPGVDAVVAAAVGRMAEAGAELVNIDVSPHLLALAQGVVTTLRGYEAPRALAVYLASRRGAPEAAAEANAVEGEEATEGSGEAAADGGEGAPGGSADSGGAAGGGGAGAPLDAALPLSALVAALPGPAWARRMFSAQVTLGAPPAAAPDSGAPPKGLSAPPEGTLPAGAISHEQYVGALAEARPRLRRELAALMAAAGGAALLVFPTVPVPAVPCAVAPTGIGGGGDVVGAAATDADEALEAGGRTHPAATLLGTAAALVAAGGLPCASVPVGLTRPRPGAVPGTAAGERLPVSLALAGAPGSDAAVLQAASALQGLQAALPDPLAVRLWGSGVSTR